MYKTNNILIFIAVNFVFGLCAYTQFLENPSLDSLWKPCNYSSTPDLQPGFFEVYQEPTDGDFYIGMIARGENSDLEKNEGIQSELLQNLELGKVYRLRVDLASCPYLIDAVGQYTDPIRLRIWGGNDTCDKAEILIETNYISHIEFVTYEYYIQPQNDSYSNFLLESYVDPWELGYLLVDNIRLEETDCPPIEVSHVFDTLIKPFAPVNLKATQSNYYYWEPANDLSCLHCRETLVQIPDSAMYSVTLTNSTGCPYKQSYSINVKPCRTIEPEVQLDTLIKQNAPVELLASESSYHSWSPKYGLNCYDCPSPVATIDASEKYTCMLRDSIDCPFREMFNIEVWQCPENLIKIIKDTTIRSDDNIPLKASRSSSYKWLPEHGLSCYDCQDPTTVDIQSSETYTCYLFDDYDCPYQEVFNLNINLFIPNVFTPNGDGVNEKFKIDGLEPGSSLKIMDRKGRVVYENPNYDNTWDGRDMKGKELKSDNYWYLLEIKGRMNKFTGYVFLKR